MQIQIVPICDDLEKISAKKKFKNLFDIAVFGFTQGAVINHDYLKNIINEKTVVFVEKSS